MCILHAPCICIRAESRSECQLSFKRLEDNWHCAVFVLYDREESRIDMAHFDKEIAIAGTRIDSRREGRELGAGALGSGFQTLAMHGRYCECRVCRADTRVNPGQVTQYRCRCRCVVVCCEMCRRASGHGL